MIGRIYVKLCIIMLHSRYRSFVSCGYREDFFHVFPIISLWQIMTPLGQACMDPRGTVGRIYKEDHYTLLHTKYGLVVLEKKFFFGFFPIVRLWKQTSLGDGAIFDPRGMTTRIYVKLSI